MPRKFIRSVFGMGLYEDDDGTVFLERTRGPFDGGPPPYRVERMDAILARLHAANEAALNGDEETARYEMLMLHVEAVRAEMRDAAERLRERVRERTKR